MTYIFVTCGSDLSDMYWQRKYNFTTHLSLIKLTRPLVAKENEKLQALNQNIQNFLHKTEKDFPFMREH